MYICHLCFYRGEMHRPISDSKTSALCLCPVPWYTSPMPMTAATCRTDRQKIQWPLCSFGECLLIINKKYGHLTKPRRNFYMDHERLIYHAVSLTWTLCGTSSSVEVGGRRAGMWMLSSLVIDMSMVPSLAEETPSRSPILVISWPYKKPGTILFSHAMYINVFSTLLIYFIHM